MAKALLYRLFGVGKTPPALHASLAGEGILYETEGIRATRRRSGHVSGSTVGAGIDLHIGGFIVTGKRLVAFFSSTKVVDVPWDIPAGTLVRAHLEPDGLHVEWDLARANTEWSGAMTLHFQQLLTADDIARFPKTSVTFDVPPDAVRAFFRGRSGKPRP